MKLILTFALLTVLAFTATAGISERQVAAIRDAIWRSEGGALAKYAYGIKSVPYRNVAQARRICENSIRNNYARWEAIGSKGDFIPFMAARYCPADKKQWARNVKWFLKDL